jgi:hypothetical protein
MIVTPDMFNGFLSLGTGNYPDALEAVRLYIGHYEPEYLRRVLGDGLACALAAALETGTPDEKWAALRDAVKKPCACYIWFCVSRRSATTTSNAREIIPAAENATAAASPLKHVETWNLMTELNARVARIARCGGYTGFAPDPDVYTRINVFSL